MFFEIFIMLALIFLNGILSMAEMAIVSARKHRLQQKLENGKKGAMDALDLKKNPNHFLSTVQIGITLIGILSGAFGGATIAEKIGSRLSNFKALAPYSEGIGVAIVVILTTYFSLVIGELVPKRLALYDAEKISIAIAPVMKLLSKITKPIANFLSGSTNVILGIFGIRPSSEPEITEEDLKVLLDEGTESGIFEKTEQDMVERIFRLNDRAISSFMTPRTEIVFLEIDATHKEIYQRITTHPFSRFPVFKDTPDNIVGIIQSRDLLLQRINGPDFDLNKILIKPIFIPESTPALDVLDLLKTSLTEIAIIVDEYGGVLGLVSINDIIEAIVGDMMNPYGKFEAEIIQREDGSWLVDGMVLMDELKESISIDKLPNEEEGNYDTLSGLMMSQLGKVPVSGDYFTWGNLRFEVVDMDGRRVDKVLIAPINNT